MAISEKVMNFLAMHRTDFADIFLEFSMPGNGDSIDCVLVAPQNPLSGNPDFYLHPTIENMDGKITWEGEDNYAFTLSDKGMITGIQTRKDAGMQNTDYGTIKRPQYFFYKMDTDVYNSLVVQPSMNLDMAKDGIYKFVQVRMDGKDYIYMGTGRIFKAGMMHDRAKEHMDLLEEFLKDHGIFDYVTEDSRLHLEEKRPVASGNRYEMIGAGACNYFANTRRLVISNEKSAEYELGPKSESIDSIVELSNTKILGKQIMLTYF